MTKSPASPVFIAAFAGHRPKESESGRRSDQLDALAPQVEATLSDLEARALKAGGTLQLTCSLAAGADVVVVETARKLGLPFHIILPKPEEDFFTEDFTGDSAPWLDRAKSIIAIACPESGGQTDFDARCTCRVAETPARSPDCYIATNILILEKCDVLLTIWNGRPAESRAGTGYLVLQARAAGLPSINLDPTNHRTTTAHLEKFAPPPSSR